jgi:hypothetical protein
MRNAILSFTLLFHFTCFSQEAQHYVPQQTTYSFNWGTKQTKITISQYGTRKDIFMINVHSNETTSVDAAKSLLEKTGGTLLQVENSDERFISFEKSGHVTRFDPNRIFTAAGLKKNLILLNHHYDKTAAAQVTSFRDFLLSYIPSSASVIIALHNNDEGGFSISSYTASGEFRKDAAATYKNPRHDGDDFFLVTKKRAFDDLKRSGYNVVLQNNARVTDDGSLSVYMGKKNRNYINTEAQHGHVREQAEMIGAATSAALR